MAKETEEAFKKRDIKLKLYMDMISHEEAKKRKLRPHQLYI